MLTLKSLTINKYSNKILIFGVGYLGQPLFFKLKEKYQTVVGITTTPSKIDPYELTDTTQDSYCQIIEKHRPDTIVVCWAPGARTDDAYHKTYLQSMGYLCKAIETHPPKKIIYTSSTGVYDSAITREVDEEDCIYSSSTKHKILIEAEEMLKNQAIKLNFNHIILRLSGLYGPDRIPCLRLLQKGERLPGKANSWLHLIHRDDACGCIEKCLDYNQSNTFIISDNHPYIKEEIYNNFASHFKTKIPQWEGSKKQSIEGKKLIVKKIHKELNWKLQYPHIKDFLQTLSNTHQP